jgi:hypothetical protein
MMGRKQREMNARIWLGSSGGGVFLGWFNPTTKCKNWVFWVVSLDDARKKSTEREMRVSGVGDIVF